MRKMLFTEENIRKIFGHEAAEDDDSSNLYNFYVKNSAYELLKSSLPLYIVVGHKGTGKSALLKILEKEEMEKGNLPIMIRPDDIFTQTETDINKMIYIWQERLSKIIFDKLIETIVTKNNSSSSDSSFKEWLKNFSKLTLSILHKKFAEIKTMKSTEADISFKNFLSLFKDVIFTKRIVTVFIDDLDRGWKNEDYEIRNISAMLNALRTITRQVPNIKFRVALRSSVYFAVRTSDESTDKIESSVVWLKWDNHSILAMLAKRVILFKKGKSVDENTLFNKTQEELSRNFEGVFESRFQGAGHWSNAPIYRVLLSLIRQRPRDLVKLCTLAAHEAFNNKHQIIQTSDFEIIFSNYSQERLTDTINEYSSELRSDILERVLLEMKPSASKKFNSFLYTPQEINLKMRSILEHIGRVTFNNSKLITEKSLATFLYKINFLTMRKDEEDRIIRYYYDDNKYIFNGNVDFGFNVEVHPAYRWALQPKNLQTLYNEIKLV